MVHLPPDRGGGGGLRPGLRGLPLRPLRPVASPAGPGGPAGHRGHRPDRGEDRRPGAAAGGRRPLEVQPGGQALRRVPGPTGAERSPRSRWRRSPTRCGCWPRRPLPAWARRRRRRGARGVPPSGPTAGSASAAVRRIRAVRRHRNRTTAAGDRGAASWRWRPCWTAGRGPAARHRPGRRPGRRGPGLAAGRNLLRAAGAGAGTPHLRGAVWRSVRRNTANVAPCGPPTTWTFKVRVYGGREGKTLRIGANSEPPWQASPRTTT